MDYTITYDEEIDACVIKVSGLHKRSEDSHTLLSVAGKFGEERGCYRFLFDMREASIQGNTTDTYNTAIDPERFGFSSLNRIASVYSSNMTEHKFMENVGVNRGAGLFRVFDDMEKARKWMASK